MIMTAIYGLAPLAVFFGALLALAFQRRTCCSWPTEKILFGIGLAAHTCTLLVYILTPCFFGPSDLSAANVARAFMDGLPMYGTPATNNTGHAVLYGPLYFLPTLIAFKLGGISVPTAKFPGALQHLAWLAGILVFQLKSREASKPEPQYLLTGMLLFLGFFMPFEFCLIQIVALYALIFRFRHGMVRPLVAGTAAAIATNLRLHGFLYVLTGLLDPEKRNRSDAVRVLLGLCIFIAGATGPFLLHGVSLKEYLGTVINGVRHGFPANVVATQACWLLLIAVGALCVAVGLEKTKPDRKTGSGTILLSGLSLAAIFLASCKAGSGPHHLIAAFPLMVFIFLRRRPPFPPARILHTAAVCLLMSLAVVGTARGLKNGYDLLRFPAHALLDEIRGLADRANGNIALGFGGTHDLEWTRPGSQGRILATGFLFPRDLGIGTHTTLMDFKQSGHDVDAFVLPKIMTSTIEHLAFPRNSSPFLIGNWYDQNPLLKPDTVDSFHQRYEFAYQGRFFDVYQLRRP